VSDVVLESVPDFRRRAATWIASHLPGQEGESPVDRALQALMFDNGFAGIAFPLEYGGAGLTLEHQKAFFDEAAAQDRQVPSTGVSVGMIGPTILDHGSKEAKRRYLPPLLRGDESWIQLLSEPGSGSDLAGSTTRLTRDGDMYLLTGSKMWSSGAHTADFGLCLCRSDWNVPKHRGLSTIAVPLRDNPRIAIQQIRAASGLLGEYCEEFFDDVPLPASNLIGEEGHGWTVAQSLLFHERNTVGNMGYGYLNGKKATSRRMFGMQSAGRMTQEADRRGTLPAVGGLIADAYIESIVDALTSARLAVGMRVGTYRGQWGSVAKLQSTVAAQASVRTALAAAGAEALVWDDEDPRSDGLGVTWIESRGGTISGGSNEMQRNIISERLFGLPREPAHDRDVPFIDVVRSVHKP
jgi:alkylation response protein AidB-like acyl-CoA dehydrogenase